MHSELSRPALHELLWNRAKTDVAKSLGISDVALGKACKKANIPVPPRGYWATLKAGKQPSRTPLPPRGLGQSETVTIRQARGSRQNEPIKELPSPPDFPESVDAVVERAKRMAGKIVVPRTLDRPHPLVAKLLEEDDQRRQKAAETSYYWDQPRFESPAARRRLRLINALFLALAKTGCRPDYHGKDAEDLYAHVGAQLVRFHIEPVKKGRQDGRMFDGGAIPATFPLRLSAEYLADGAPCIRTAWHDTEEQRLEACVAEAVVSILVIGELHYRFLVIRRHEWLVERKHAQDEAIRRAQELAERQACEAHRQKERARRLRLFALARNRKRAAEVREFVATVLKHDDAEHHRTELQRWAAWALSEADALDPMKGALVNLITPAEAPEPDAPSDTGQ